LDAGEISKQEKASGAAEKTQKRAGAPLFRLSPPKRCRGVAPALHASRVPFFPWLSRSKHFVMQPVLYFERKKEETHVALLRAPSKKPKTATLQVRLEEDVKLKLENYAEFIDATPSYVISEALKLLFKKDDEFRHWLDQHPANHDGHGIEGGLFTKTA
jgi:hypothetical protein